MNRRTVNTELLRAALAAAEERLKEILNDIQNDTLDMDALTHRLARVEENLRLVRRAA
jgi:hypothetical protein